MSNNRTAVIEHEACHLLPYALKIICMSEMPSLHIWVVLVMSYCCNERVDEETPSDGHPLVPLVTAKPKK